MNFLKKVKSSIYDPAFYQELLGKPLKYSFKYFFGLIVVISLISTAFLSVTLIPKAKVFLNSFSAEIQTSYPAELEITIKDGMASTNVQEPYFVKIPDNDKDKDNAGYENILVIDTKHDLSLSDLDSYKTLILLTKDNLVYKDKQGKITVQSLSRTPNITVNKTKVTGWVNTATPYLNTLVIFLPAVFFVGLFFLHLLALVHFIFAGLLVWLVAKLKKINITYGKSYQIAMHAGTLGIILGAGALDLFPLVPIPFLPTIVLIVIVVINLKKSQIDSSN